MYHAIDRETYPAEAKALAATASYIQCIQELANLYPWLHSTAHHGSDIMFMTWTKFDAYIDRLVELRELTKASNVRTMSFPQSSL